MVKSVNEIKRITCLGGGVIGSSWAVQFAMKGLSVTLRDINDEMLENSRIQIEKSLDTLIAYQAIAESERDAILSRIRMTTSVEDALREVDLIQENGPERLPIKQGILADADKYAPDALYCSSTSGLLVTDIAAASAHPERVVGAHPYNPPHLIPLVEITKGEKTSDEALQLVYDFYQSIGKEAVLLQKECMGFIANRLQLAVFREMMDLVARGVCSVGDCDKALVFGPGIRWGVFGQYMIMQMANPGGFAGMMKMLGAAGNVWLPDMASWTVMPDTDQFIPGIEEELKNLPEFMGNDTEACIQFRDKALIDILKIHKKL